MTLTVAAEPDSALLATAAALRRLGARLTRYDAEAATIEAKRGDDTIRLTMSAAGRERSRLQIETDASGARRFVRQLRAELARPTGETRR